MPTYIDVHVLQSVPPSNINRDDTGAPKTAYYGGVRRARVSSQAWKRATRAQFKDTVDPAELGHRTKRLVELLAPRIQQRSELDEAQSQALAAKALQALGLKLEKARAKKNAPEGEGDQVPKAEYLVFLSSHQLDALAEVAVAGSAGTVDKAAAKKAVDTRHGVEVALFGRMVADAADLNVDAAVQMAHAISTHPVDNEFDYYTAVDDENPDEETGAGMIGTIEYNSSTLYRFATINIAGLRANLGDNNATAMAAAAFVRGFVTSMPTGKQNSFGNRTLPDAVLVTVRHDQPVSLVGAFEEPVRSADGYLRQSAERLAVHARGVADAYGAGHSHAWVVRASESAAAVDELGERVSLDELIDRIRETAGSAVEATGS